MDKSKTKCEYCKSTGKHISNDYYKKLNEGKQKDDKEVVKKVVSKSGAGKTPAGTPSVCMHSACIYILTTFIYILKSSEGGTFSHCRIT